MNLMPWVVSWSVLATVVLALAVYRKMVARKEDDFLHVDANLTAQQEAVAKKLEQIDKWGKNLTIVVGIFALVLLGMFLYNGWHESSKIAG
jgi:predicted nicotinamide N-methyase